VQSELREMLSIHKRTVGLSVRLSSIGEPLPYSAAYPPAPHFSRPTLAVRATNAV
jgi:hypothetical protein